MKDSPVVIKRLQLIGAFLVVLMTSAGCGSSAKQPASSPTSLPATTTSGAAPTAESNRPTSTTPVAVPSAGQSLPVAVQTDAAMKAAGNIGPSSSILVPSSCIVASTRATATGTYEGGLAPEIYRRSGDVVDLYVFSGTVPGYPNGIQLATPFTSNAPPVGGSGSWTVTVPIDTSIGQPARCLIAAQPTHDFEGAPSAY